MVRRGRGAVERPIRDVDYRHLVNPFEPHRLYTDDQIHQIHRTALRVLSDVGVRVLLPEALQLLEGAGCHIDDGVVRFDPDVIDNAVSSAPSEFVLRGATSDTDVVIGGQSVVWIPASGIPHASDLDGGKRPAQLKDFNTHLMLTEHFDVMHINSTGPEPQDVEPEFRHLETVPGMLRLTSKHPHIYSRGSPQVRDAFEMMRIGRGLTKDEFESEAWTYTIINTNSPLQLDIPMMQGTIDFARAGQMVCITPFTLAGAMAPVTLAGALVQQHAEFLAALDVHQTARPGAAVVYGAFTSNVDMRSGSPAFGTPENVRAAFASGQLARFLDIPWRSSMPSVSNLVDAQSAYETGMAMWGSILGGSNMTVHCAGWVEGGLTVSFEKFVVDCEVLQQAAELMQPVKFDEGELAFDAIAGVGQGGHFFGQPHTMERYQTAFYEPFLSDWSNFGTWTDRGSLDATTRANAIWKMIVAEFEAPGLPQDRDAEITEFVNRRRAEGGAHPVS